MSDHFDVTMTETRAFPPSAEFSKNAYCTPELFQKWQELGARDPEAYWAEAARELTWDRPFKKITTGDSPFIQWFADGMLNASVNCVDRHLKTQPQKAALIWEGEPGEVVTWTYRELHEQISRAAAALRKLGIVSGDCVAIYLPLIPEAVAAMLACARVGATHTVVFGGFSSEALKDRIHDSNAKAVITADFGWRKGTRFVLEAQVSDAIAQCPSIREVIVIQRERAGSMTDSERKSYSVPAGGAVASETRKTTSGSFRRTDWHLALSAVTQKEQKTLGSPESVPAEHPLYILYTSGTTGKPKGLVHSTGGYLAGVLRTFRTVFDDHPQDLYWCTADIGWVTGHSYVVYGPLAAGASVFLYEGAPMYPTPDRFWAMIERHRISVLYTAPTAIRAFMRLGDELPKGRDLSSLRLLGSVGEPINPEAWMWYRDQIGGGRCPIVDTYWQTETGAIVVSPTPGVHATKPGSAMRALPGYDVAILDKQGNLVPKGKGGYLVIRKPWPSRARTIHGDAERFKKTYFSEFPNGIYFTGDGARMDEGGDLWCLGRVDDVLNVSGHRLGTMEIESTLVAHPKVAEAAVVGRPDEIKGQGVVAFVTLKAHFSKETAGDTARLKIFADELKAHVTQTIGAIARPDEIRFTDGLPKTRSGKIMRRLLRELAAGGAVKGDVTTLEDLNVIAALQKSDDE